MTKRSSIIRLITRHYSDSGQNSAIVEWADGSTKVGGASDYHGILVPEGTHMGQLFDRGLREGLTVEREIW